MENQKEKTMENEMETVGIWRFQELNLSYYIGGHPIIYAMIPIMATEFKFLNCNPEKHKAMFPI